MLVVEDDAILIGKYRGESDRSAIGVCMRIEEEEEGREVRR